MNMQLLQQVNQFLAQLDLPPGRSPLQVGALGICQIRLDEVDLTIELVSTTARLAVSGQLSDHVQTPGSPAAYTSFDLETLRSLVRANFLGCQTGGATIFIDPATEELSIGTSLPIEALDGERLQSVLLGMVDQVHNWRTHLAPSTQVPVVPADMSVNWLSV